MSPWARGSRLIFVELLNIKIHPAFFVRCMLRAEDVSMTSLYKSLREIRRIINKEYMKRITNSISVE